MLEELRTELAVDSVVGTALQSVEIAEDSDTSNDGIVASEDMRGVSEVLNDLDSLIGLGSREGGYRRPRSSSPFEQRSSCGADAPHAGWTEPCVYR